MNSPILTIPVLIHLASSSAKVNPDMIHSPSHPLTWSAHLALAC
jgi:hypothetical protein